MVRRLPLEASEISREEIVWEGGTDKGGAARYDEVGPAAGPGEARSPDGGHR